MPLDGETFSELGERRRVAPVCKVGRSSDNRTSSEGEALPRAAPTVSRVCRRVVV